MLGFSACIRVEESSENLRNMPAETCNLSVSRTECRCAGLLLGHLVSSCAYGEVMDWLMCASLVCQFLGPVHLCSTGDLYSFHGRTVHWSLWQCGLMVQSMYGSLNSSSDATADHFGCC